MPTAPPSAPLTRLVWLTLGLAAVAAVAGRSLAPLPEASAAPLAGVAGLDSDLDGLVDTLELVRGTSALDADTDGDGFLDLVELAQNANPGDPNSIPASINFALALLPHASGGVFRLSQVVYVPDNDISGVTYNLFVRWQGVTLPVDPSLYLAGATFNFVPSEIGSDGVAVITTYLPVAVMEFLGPVSFLATGGPSGATSPTAAAGTTVLPVGGALNEVQTAQQAGFGELGSGTVYRPLQPAEELPGGYTPGQICYQTSVPQGTSDGMLVYEVDTSNCEAAFAFCSPACELQTGTTFELVDPLALLGG
ncbi:MAG: hypothetical protein GC161_04105 [Planctomycetaceae bacterium]|nr:hypothetical protein [Planctomycetaceae bacterium]